MDDADTANVRPYDELAAWLRDEPATGLSAAALEEARRQGVHLIVAERRPVPELAREVRGAVIVEAARTHELRRIVEALAGRGVDALWFKGAALAYTLYARPDLRPASDADLLIRAGDRGLVFETFQRLGYEPEAQISGDLISAQRCFTRRAGPLTHAIDIHWKLVNPLEYADLITFDDLWLRAETIPSLSINSRMPSLADHLVISCLHRVAHHQNTGHLLWLYDIHLLARRLDDQQRQAAIARARACKLSAACYLGLSMAQTAFGGIDLSFLSAFAIDDGGNTIAPVFLSPESTQIALVHQEWRTLKGLSPRLRLLREHLFPPAAYVRSIYPRIPRVLLPLAYALRVARGAPKWFMPRA